MNRTQHPTNNDVLSPPDGMSAREGRALPVTRTKWLDGTDAFISYWRPSDEEIEDMRKGALVALWTLGRTTPPVAIEVDSP